MASERNKVPQKLVSIYKVGVYVGRFMNHDAAASNMLSDGG